MGTSGLRRENDHVLHVEGDGSALSSEERRELILHRISAIHVAPKDTNAHTMSATTSASRFSVTGTNWLDSSLSLRKPRRNEGEMKVARDMSGMAG